MIPATLRRIRRGASLLGALLLGPLLASALLAAPTVTLDRASGQVVVEAKGEPLHDVLSAIKRETKVNIMILDPELELRPVTLTGRYESGAAAVRAAALAARATVSEAGNVLVLQRSATSATARSVTITAGPDGLYRCPGSLAYPVAVLGDGPEDRTISAAFAGFEHRQGIGLISAREVEERAMREYLEARHVYRQVLARAGSPILLSDAVEQRQVRVYVDPPRDRMYAEILFAQAGTSGAETEVVHVIFILKAQAGSCDAVVLFKRRIDWTPPPPSSGGMSFLEALEALTPTATARPAPPAAPAPR